MKEYGKGIDHWTEEKLVNKVLSFCHDQKIDLRISDKGQNANKS
jgi:hypothetical protein